MDRVSDVLDRVAVELEGLADRLRQVSVCANDAPGEAVRLSARTLVALQEIDRSEQLARSLGLVVARLAASDRAGGGVDADVLTEGIPLDRVSELVRGTSSPASEGTVELF